MNLETIPVEFEFQALQIAKKNYPNVRFKLILKKQDKHELLLLFKAFYKEEDFTSFSGKNNICIDDIYQMNTIDFDIWFVGKNLLISSFWRRKLLTLIYESHKNFIWMSDDGEEIPRPYPDGLKFENMALDLYPLLTHYFSVNFDV